MIQPALQVLRGEGVLFLASTDGRSPTGHERVGAVRSLGSAARVHPASWELALRHQLGLIARLAWMNGRGIWPLLSISDGRTFRNGCACSSARMQGRKSIWAFWHAVSPVAISSNRAFCNDGMAELLLPVRERAMAGERTLWLGLLQDPICIEALMQLTVFVAAATKRLLKRLQADPGCPARVWSTAELSKRLGLFRVRHRCRIWLPPWRPATRPTPAA